MNLGEKMKKTALMALICAFVSVPSAASDWKVTCEKISSLAQSIMKSRQAGVAMSDAIRVADGNTGIEGIVIAAYEKPRYSTASVQKRTIEEFRDEIYLTCSQVARQ